jgi:hypothetical protein
MHMQHHNISQYTSPAVPAQDALWFLIFLEVTHAGISLTHGVLIPGIIKRTEQEPFP